MKFLSTLTNPPNNERSRNNAFPSFILAPVNFEFNIGQRMKKLSPEQKLEIYQEFLGSDNKSAVARTYGIDRSYLYDIVAGCNKGLRQYLQQQKSGRKEADIPSTYTAAVEKIKELEAGNLEMEKEKEELHVKNTFLELRLSWAEGDTKKHHLKKTKNSKP